MRFGGEQDFALTQRKLEIQKSALPLLLGEVWFIVVIPRTSIWRLCGQNLLVMMHIICHLLSNSDTDSRGLLSLICVHQCFQ